MGVQRTIQYVARTAGDQTLHIVFLGNLVECATQFRRDAVARCQSVDAAEFRFLTGGDAVRVCLGLGLGIVDKIAGQQHCIRGTGQIQHTDHKFIAVGHNPFVGGVQLGDAIWPSASRAARCATFGSTLVVEVRNPATAWVEGTARFTMRVRERMVGSTS